MLALVKELYEYHKAVSEHLAPLVEFSVREKYSEKHEAKECSSVPVAWKAVSEVRVITCFVCLSVISFINM